jgi:hypothetical protein
MILCPRCREEVDPDDPDTIRTFEQVATPTFGELDDTRDGMRAAFHPDCYDPGDPRYQRED